MRPFVLVRVIRPAQRMEMTMDQASQLFVRPDLRRHDAIALPRVVIHFAVAPHATMTWRAIMRVARPARATACPASPARSA